MVRDTVLWMKMRRGRHRSSRNRQTPILTTAPAQNMLNGGQNTFEMFDGCSAPERIEALEDETTLRNLMFVHSRLRSHAPQNGNAYDFPYLAGMGRKEQICVELVEGIATLLTTDVEQVVACTVLTRPNNHFEIVFAAGVPMTVGQQERLRRIELAFRSNNVDELARVVYEDCEPVNALRCRSSDMDLNTGNVFESSIVKDLMTFLDRPPDRNRMSEWLANAQRKTSMAEIGESIVRLAVYAVTRPDIRLLINISYLCGYMKDDSLYLHPIDDHSVSESIHKLGSMSTAMEGIRQRLRILHARRKTATISFKELKQPLQQLKCMNTGCINALNSFCTVNPNVEAVRDMKELQDAYPLLPPEPPDSPSQSHYRAFAYSQHPELTVALWLTHQATRSSISASPLHIGCSAPICYWCDIYIRRLQDYLHCLRPDGEIELWRRPLGRHVRTSPIGWALPQETGQKDHIRDLAARKVREILYRDVDAIFKRVDGNRPKRLDTNGYTSLFF